MIRDFLDRMVEKADHFVDSKRNLIRSAITQAKNFLGGGWQTITSRIDKIKYARKVDINFTIVPLSFTMLRNLRRREHSIISSINRQLEGLGWRIERRRVGRKTLHYFTDNNNINFTLVRHGSIALSSAMKIALFVFAVTGVVIIGASVIVDDVAEVATTLREPTAQELIDAIRTVPEEERAPLVDTLLERDHTPTPFFEQIKGNIEAIIIGIVIVFIFWFAIKIDAPAIAKRRLK